MTGDARTLVAVVTDRVEHRRENHFAPDSPSPVSHITPLPPPHRSPPHTSFYFYLFIFNIDFREKRGKKGNKEEERGKKESYRFVVLLIYIYSLVDSYMCADQGLNLQTWYIGMMI